ncbi:hypothetical protein [Alkaliflexus imshenetskii]|uniref:hypothetical protein n=1 Tax=Alkaliflexus imshenetskii TaxID=286730 RepID=UPI0004B1FC62|nr:hypothetical protein [Alkaliflexus imshenetskii]
MNEFLIILALSVFFICLALLGLAVKSFFKKDAQLTTCSGSGSGSGCGCGTQTACVDEK